MPDNFGIGGVIAVAGRAVAKKFGIGKQLLMNFEAAFEAKLPEIFFAHLMFYLIKKVDNKSNPCIFTHDNKVGAVTLIFL